MKSLKSIRVLNGSVLTLIAVCAFSLVNSLHAQVVLGAVRIADPLKALPQSTVVVSRGDASVTLADVDALVMKAEEEQRAVLVSDDKRLAQMLESTMLIKQLAKQGAALNLVEKDAFIKLRVQRAYDEELAAATMEYLAAQAPKESFTQLAKEMYLANESNYAVPKSHEVQHILIGNQSRTDAEAKAAVEKLLIEMSAPGADFTAAVLKVSDDPSKAQNQGFLSVSKPDEFVAAFDAAARALKTPNELSPVVKTEYGYHILKLLKVQPATVQSFETVQPSLEAELRRDHQQKYRSKLLSDLRAAELKSQPDVIDSIKTRYGTLPEMLDVKPAAADANAPAASPPVPQPQSAN